LKYYSLLAFCLLVLVTPCWALEKIPEPVGLVNDAAQVFKRPQDLEARLFRLEKNTGAEMTVVTRLSLPKDESLEAYSTRLFNQWGLGKKQDQNGLLFLLALKERKMRLEVGSGLKTRLSDSQAQALLDQSVKPKFKNQDYDGGLAAALDQIEQKLKQKSLQELEAGVETYAEPAEKAWIWGIALLGAGALFLLFVGYWLLRFVMGFFRSFGKTIRQTSGTKPTRGVQVTTADTESYSEDTWRSSFSSESDSSSSYDSFGGGSSDGGGASSDW
jgi:uncharacterized protein